MKKSSRFLRFLLAIGLVGLGVGFMFYFEFELKDKIDTVDVVVAKESINFKEQIAAGDLEVRSVRRGTEVDGAISPVKAETLVGKHASIAIKKGTQIYTEMIDTYDLVPDDTKGEFVAPIPADWLFAVPGSLRRTYVADIYAISDKDAVAIKELAKDARNANPDTENDEEETAEIIETNVAPDSLPILENVRVASVKDGSNKEVVQSEETKEATGQVAALEIIANDETLETITDFTEAGYKLYVVYKFERSEISE